MSSIENNQSLNNILEKIGVKTPDNTPNTPKSSLGQEDFLKLMTTQLQNQDPFAPMENGEFIAQMAQFSTVTGITEMGETLKGLANKLDEFRIATASDLLGNSFLYQEISLDRIKMAKSMELLTYLLHRAKLLSRSSMKLVK